MTVKTASAKETADFGAQLAKQLAPGSVVCLYGELGAGKTTLVQGIARGLGIKKRLISPTFVLARRYKLPVSKIRNPVSGYLWHIDLYRLEEINDAKAIGIEELLAISSNILLVEWPEKIETLLPKNRINVKLQSIGESKRDIFYETLH